MSMINEFVEKLREKSVLFSRSDFAVAGIAKDYKEAADIIEELSAKLASANMERSEKYYKSNSEFVEKLIDGLEELRKSESDREDYSDNHDYYDDWKYAFEDGASDGRHYAYVKSIKIIKELAEEYKDVPDTNVGTWIPVSEHYPDTEKHILLSFSNFSIPVVGRWEEDDSGGAFYIGDEDDSCVSQDLYVNAWQPLPQPYKGE